jgi:hypothetical protein
MWSVSKKFAKLDNKAKNGIESRSLLLTTTVVGDVL